MAKLPPWLVQTQPMTYGTDADGRPCAVVTLRVRRWHPYVWWMFMKAALRGVSIGR